MEPEIRSDGVKAVVFPGGLGKAPIGNVLVKRTPGNLPVLINQIAHSGSNQEGEAEILALGTGNRATIGKAKANTGLDVRNPARAGLDKMVTGAEGGTDETIFRAIQNGVEEGGKEKLCVAPEPAGVSNRVELPPNGGDLRRDQIVVLISHIEESGGLVGEAYPVLPEIRGFNNVRT